MTKSVAEKYLHGLPVSEWKRLKFEHDEQVQEETVANFVGWTYFKGWKYELPASDYLDLYEAQEGSCGICGEVGSLHIDHNHITGKVRGLLCQTCNWGLGQLKGDKGTDLLQNAIRYLEV